MKDEDKPKALLINELAQLRKQIAKLKESEIIHRREELLLAGQNRILKLLATEGLLEEVLTALINVIEEQSPGMLGSVLLMDEHKKCLRHGAAPKLPDDYNREVDGIEVGPCAGSCGTAAYRRETVIVQDITTDPLWKDYSELGLKHRLRACWSEPIFATDGRVLGTFAMYYRQPIGPKPEETKLMKEAAHLAGIAIERKKMEKQIQKYNEELQKIVEERAAKIENLQKQRAEIEKLAAAGQMAAGVAHEINNPLAGIKNSFLLIKDSIPLDHKYYEYVGRIESEIETISNIVAQMYQLYQPKYQQPRYFDLASAVTEVCQLIQTSARKDRLHLKTEFAKGLPEVCLPEGFLKQVLYNIIQNAIDASLKEETIEVNATKQKNRILIQVRDHGQGISQEILPHIFEPFFSTKNADNGKGLGLGLSVSHSLINAMGGKIDVKTKLNQGSTFTITLPSTYPIDTSKKKGELYGRRRKNLNR